MMIASLTWRNGMDEPPAKSPLRIVVCGLGRFGLLVVESLCASGHTVTVVTDRHTGADRVERAEACGARIVRGDFRSARVRREAGIENAAAAVLVTASDVHNLEAALEIRGEAPGVSVVMRYSEPRFAPRFEDDFGITAAMAPECLAAEAFVEAALQTPVPTAVSGLGVTRAASHDDMPWHSPRLSFIAIPLAFLALYLLGIVIFRWQLGLGWVDAAYFTTSIVTTVGFGDINLQHAPDWVKLFGIVLMFAGIVLIAIIASLLTIFIVSGTADQMRNEYRVRRLRGHVVVCGLGHVGLAVARGLRARGVPAVVVDSDAPDDAHRDFRVRCPVIVGDAKRPVVLARAGAHRARALIACTSNDALNLEIGLAAQSFGREARAGQPLRLVLRCFDADLARRIHAVSADYTLLSEARIAAPVFAEIAAATRERPADCQRRGGPDSISPPGAARRTPPRTPDR